MTKLGLILASLSTMHAVQSCRENVTNLGLISDSVFTMHCIMIWLHLYLPLCRCELSVLVLHTLMVSELEEGRALQSILQGDGALGPGQEKS